MDQNEKRIDNVSFYMTNDTSTRFYEQYEARGINGIQLNTSVGDIFSIDIIDQPFHCTLKGQEDGILFWIHIRRAVGVYTEDTADAFMQFYANGDKPTVKTSGRVAGDFASVIFRYLKICVQLRKHIDENDLYGQISDLDPESEGILVKQQGEAVVFERVAGKKRPDMACMGLLGGVQMLRPYPDESINALFVDVPSFEDDLQKAENGDTEAMGKVGATYLSGSEDDGIEADAEKAAYWFRKQAEAGDAVGQFDLAILYLKGEGVEQNFEQALYWMKKAEENGDPDAPGHVQQYTKLVELQKKADAGDAQAMAELAGMLMAIGRIVGEKSEAGFYEKSIALAQAAEQENVPAAQYVLALAYENGRGVEKNTKKAMEHYERGAQLGSAECQHNLGCCYLDGDPVPEDKERGFELCMEAAKQGCGPAMKTVGRCYQFGNGVQQSMKHAVYWYEKALERIQDPELAQKVAVFKTLPDYDDEPDAVNETGAASAAGSVESRLEANIVQWFREKDTLISEKDILAHFSDYSEKEVKAALGSLLEQGVLFGGPGVVVNDLYGLDDSTSYVVPVQIAAPPAHQDAESVERKSKPQASGTKAPGKKEKDPFSFPESNRLDLGRYSLIIPEGFSVERDVDGRAFWAWLPKKSSPEDRINAPILLMEGMFMPDLGGGMSVQERIDNSINGMRMIAKLSGMDIAEPEEFHNGDVHGFVASMEDAHHIGTVMLPEGAQQIRVQANLKKYQGEYAKEFLLAVLKTVRIKGDESGQNKDRQPAKKSEPRTAGQSNMTRAAQEQQRQKDAVCGFLSAMPRSTCAAVADYMGLTLHSTTGLLTILRKEGLVRRDYDGKTPLYSLGADDDFEPASHEKATQSAKNVVSPEQIQALADRRALIAAAKGMIAADFGVTVAVPLNGKVNAIGDNKNGQSEVTDWTDVIAVATGGMHTVGLKSDGTVVATPLKVSDERDDQGQCNVSHWNNITAVSAGYMHTVGLKSDGTVVAVGNNSSGECNTAGWKNIVEISADGSHTIGLKSDGTVIATGENTGGCCSVKEWKDIIAISTGFDHTLGLKADGTVVATRYSGEFPAGQCNVEGWKNIVDIAAGSTCSVGLRADGTVVSTRPSSYASHGQDQVSSWKDIIGIATCESHTIGLKSNGTLVATNPTGKNADYGQAEVSAWKLFNNISTLDEERKAAAEQAEIDRKNKIYSNACIIAKRNSSADLRSAISSFKSISGWKDADDQRKACEKRLEEALAEEKRKQEEEAARIAKEKAEAEEAARQKKKRLIKSLTWIGVIILLGALAVGGYKLYMEVIRPANAYKTAETLYASGEYQEAEEAFLALGEYKDAAAKADESHGAWLAARYDAAQALLDSGEYDEAEKAFLSLGNYKDSVAKAKAAITTRDYVAAEAIMESGKYEAAAKAFEAIEDSSEAEEMAKECWYLLAGEYRDKNDLSKASDIYGKIQGYKDATQIKTSLDQQLAYDKGIAAFEAGKYEQAVNALKEAGTYSDAAEKLEEAQQKLNEELYAKAGEQYAADNYKDALANYQKLGDYRDSAKKAEQAEDALKKQEEAAALRKAWDGTVLFNSSQGGYFVFEFEWGEGATSPTVYFSDAAGRHWVSISEISTSKVVLYDGRGVTHTITKSSSGNYTWRWESTSGIRFN